MGLVSHGRRPWREGRAPQNQIFNNMATFRLIFAPKWPYYIPIKLNIGTEFLCMLPSLPTPSLFSYPTFCSLPIPSFQSQFACFRFLLPSLPSFFPPSQLSPLPSCSSPSIIPLFPFYFPLHFIPSPPTRSLPRSPLLFHLFLFPLQFLPFISTHPFLCMFCSVSPFSFPLCPPLSFLGVGWVWHAAGFAAARRCLRFLVFCCNVL